MKTEITATMNVNNNLVGVLNVKGVDYISLTDLARYKNSDIALEFASWIDLAFKLYLIKAFERFLESIFCKEFYSNFYIVGGISVC